MEDAFIKKKLLLVAGVLLVLVFVLINAIARTKMSQPDKDLPGGDNITLAPTARPKVGMMSLVAGQTNASVGSNIKLVLNAQAAGKQLNGFDVLVEFDKSALEFVSAEPLDKGLQLFSFAHDKYITFTVAKKPGAAKTVDLSSKADLLELIFTAKKPGSHEIRIAEQLGKEKTAIVGGNLEVFEPSTAGITVTVQ